jgi:tetratricopeptide (TPR) repeat protein
MSSILLNPYVVGGAISDVSGRAFYGREDIFEFVRSSLRVTRRAPILLYGQRRIGKSSILRQLPRHLPADYFCVYYDLQGKAELTLDQVLYGLGRAIADTLSLPRPERKQATEDTFPAFLEQAISAMGGNAERIVLLFDEFDVIDQRFASADVAASRFIPYLASLVSSQPAIGYVLVVGRKTDELSEGFFSALLKDSIQKRVGRLDLEQTAHLVRESTQGSITVTESAVDRIYSFTAGQPFCVQVLCHTVWNRLMQNDPSRVMESKHVDEAIESAIELGANGLNWIYDGLEKPAHRLILSSLASLAGEKAFGSASLDAIDTVLVSRHSSLHQTEIRIAIRDLESWDVVARNGDGIGFVVPMIGHWIQKNRPLERLEQETRLVNPRATKLYELALESHARGDYDAAINEYQDALKENSVYIEAQIGLADSFRMRRKPGDLEKAIEAYERVLDLDPTSPRTTLLESLTEYLEANKTDMQNARNLFTRIQELDPQGPFRERARRALERMSAVRMTYGSFRYLKEAIELFRLLGNRLGEAEAREKFRRSDRIANWAIPFFFLFLGLALNITALAKFPLPPIFRVGCADLVATIFVIYCACENDGVVKLRRLNLHGLVAGFLSGFAVLHFWNKLGWAWAVAFLVSFFLGMSTIPMTSPPVELSPTRSTGSQSVREIVASTLERLARNMRSRSRKSP